MGQISLIIFNFKYIVVLSFDISIPILFKNMFLLLHQFIEELLPPSYSRIWEALLSLASVINI